ncbi:MAG: hypothetical protein IPI03_01760 [Rubrivivax sp.]|jgi:hypothetical protein|nr:hypothetical protein [Rubrivivax sp.]MBK7260676.1 hypothetical protein [Rubrivivax sp.]MBK8526349.1 hypothetical protein [Rubrivivax sp.]
MDIYLKLPGHAGASVRRGYRHWLEVQQLLFDRPLLEKDAAAFTIFKTPDALSSVLMGLRRSGKAFSRVRVHQVEGSEALGRLRFDQVRVSGFTIDGAGDLAMECVQFSAKRWQPE